MSSLHKQATKMVLNLPKGSKEKIYCILLDYNQHMGEVDLRDQHISYYSMSDWKTKMVEESYMEIFGCSHYLCSVCKIT